MIVLTSVYLANVVVAGYIGASSLFYPKYASMVVFSNAYKNAETIQLVGCLWLGIAFLSALGLWKPYLFSPVLLLQLVYKSAWILVVAVPAIQHGVPYPRGMAFFFMVWIIVLPFVIPWAEWLK